MNIIHPEPEVEPPTELREVLLPGLLGGKTENKGLPIKCSIIVTGSILKIQLFPTCFNYLSESSIKMSACWDCFNPSGLPDTVGLFTITVQHPLNTSKQLVSGPAGVL